MNKKNREKTKKLMVLFSLLFSLILVNFGTILTINWNNSDDLTDLNPINEDKVHKFEEFPTSSQALNYTGSGENMNVTLHQSLIDSTVKEFNNLDVLNSFTEPFPNFNGYSTSFINISIEDIYAPNKSIIVEDTDDGSTLLFLIQYWTSFEVVGDCYLDNLSLMVHTRNVGDTFNIDIFNATYQDPDIKYHTDLNGAPVLTSSVVYNVNAHWINITGLNTFLDVSKTYNNTFFVRMSTISGDGYWHQEDESDGDDSIVWSTGGSNPETLDMALKVDLSPKSNTPLPSEIVLKVNSNDVTDITSGSGYFFNSTPYASGSDNIEFKLTAEWYDVYCNVTNVQINYTKSDINAQSDFEIFYSGDVVQWNATIPTGLNLFDGRITDHNTINFTIPSTWIDNTIKVYNVSEISSSNINKRLLGNGYREVQILNAGNGTLWCLTANSTNLLSSIDTYINDIAISSSYIANFSSIIEFNATFSEVVNDGSLNLSVYSPTPHYMNNTVLLPISSSGTEFLVDNWDVSDDINDYGVFLVQMSWNNDTAAAYTEKYITIYADTQIDPTPTIPRSTFDSGDLFDIEVYFNDTGLVEAIDGATLNFSINSNPLRGDNIDYSRSSLGYYNISIDCNDTQFAAYGDNVIDVSISKKYYNNQTGSITITIIGKTSATITSPLPDTEYDSSETINLVVFYNNTVKDVGIGGANVEYSLNGGSFSSTGVVDNTDGYYSVGISATHIDFNGYGWKTIIVNSSLDYYHNQSNSIDIKILGESSISLVKIPDKAYYNSAETFNISVYYEDTAKSIGISGATVDIDVDGTLYTPTVYDNKDGWYNITIDCSNLVFYPYANFGIRINVSASYYYNQTDTLNTIIVGEVSLTTLSPAINTVYVEGNNFVLTVQYQDTEQSSGIDGATIAYSLNDGSSYNFTGVVDNTDGTYDIPIYAGDSAFLRYGFVDIIINASKFLYENSSTTFTFHRQINTVITPSLNYDLGSVRRGLNASYTFSYFDDSVNPILQGTMGVINAQGFGSFLQNHNNGSYTIHLDSTNAVVMDDQVFVFNISSIGNETQVLQLTIDVTIKETEVVNISYFEEIVRFRGDNQSIRFYFNDTTNTLPVLGVTTNDIFLRNYGTGTLWNSGGFWLVDSWNNGTYILEVDMGTRSSGEYTLEVNASKLPDYEESIFLVTFYFRGNSSDINLISLSDPGGQLSPVGLHNYTMFEGSDLTIEFNITDSDFLDSLIIGDADSYTIRYTNLGAGSNGFLIASLNFITQLHRGTIFTSNPVLTIGRYSFNITTSRTNYEDATFLFNLTVIEKYLVNLTVVYQPVDVDAGNDFSIIIKAEFYNGTDWNPIYGSDITIFPFFNGLASPALLPISTNTTGEVLFVITINVDANRMNLTIQLAGEYYHQDYRIYVSDINVIPLDPGITFEDLIPYIIMIGAVAVVVVGAVATYRGVIVPKKK